VLADNEGYNVHHVSALLPTYLIIINNLKEGRRSQNLILFIRKCAISAVSNINGTRRFPNPPIKAHCILIMNSDGGS